MTQHRINAFWCSIEVYKSKWTQSFMVCWIILLNYITITFYIIYPTTSTIEYFSRSYSYIHRYWQLKLENTQPILSIAFRANVLTTKSQIGEILGISGIWKCWQVSNTIICSMLNLRRNCCLEIKIEFIKEATI